MLTYQKIQHFVYYLLDFNVKRNNDRNLDPLEIYLFNFDVILYVDQLQELVGRRAFQALPI